MVLADYLIDAGLAGWHLEREQVRAGELGVVLCRGDYSARTVHARPASLQALRSVASETLSHFPRANSWSLWVATLAGTGGHSAEAPPAFFSHEIRHYTLTRVPGAILPKAPNTVFAILGSVH